MVAYCTLYNDIYHKDNGRFITVSAALHRIRDGFSMRSVERLRNEQDKGKAGEIKKKLPCICFSGKFNERLDDKIIEHSGFLVLDFDNVYDISETWGTLQTTDFIYAVWLSPSGTGLKALVRIADGSKHREHFAALQHFFPDIDSSGVNQSRVCYESYDPNIYINENSKIFTRVTTSQNIKEVETVADETEILSRLLKWLYGKGMAFQSGERNKFIFLLAGACCRYGIREDIAVFLISKEFSTENDFTNKEMNAAIKSGYKRNESSFGTEHFEFERLVNKKTHKEVELKHDIADLSLPALDVVYGADVKEQALGIFRNGYESLKGIGVPEMDNLFKDKKGEITVLTGIGNYGKSTLYKWRMLMRILMYGEKFATFAPEDNPPHEYYHDFVEMLLGCNCTPENPYKPHEQVYKNAYDFVSAHIFYIYPKDLIPSPAYIKERFLELIIKEKVSGCCIDPFNQLSHDYSKTGRSDKYLETVLGDFSRFAQQNEIYFLIIAHPKQLVKQANGNYPCPDVFDLNDGAMWNNKMDNILVYHRPFMQTDPSNPACEFHSKKIRRQKTVGKRGFMDIEYYRISRRYVVNNTDYMGLILRDKQLDFSRPL